MAAPVGPFTRSIRTEIEGTEGSGVRGSDPNKESHMPRKTVASTRRAPMLVALAAVALVSCTGEEPARSPAAGKAAEAQTRLEASEAGRTVLRAIDAAGGLEAWYSAPTSSYTWEYANVGANLQFESHLIADNSSRRIYHQLLALGDYGDPQEVEGRFAWDGNEAWIWPAEIEKINPRFWAATGYYFSSIPFVLADASVILEALPDEELDGAMYDMVRATYAEGTGDASDTYTLYVDKETGRLRAIRYTVTFGGRPARGESLFYYENYSTIDGLTVPTHFKGFQFVDGKKGDFRNEAFVSNISFRVPFDETQLQMPEGGRIQPMPGN